MHTAFKNSNGEFPTTRNVSVPSLADLLGKAVNDKKHKIVSYILSQNAESITPGFLEQILILQKLEGNSEENLKIISQLKDAIEKLDSNK